MDLRDFLAQFRARNAGTRKPRAWYELTNAADSGELELFIYDYIGFDPWFGGVAAKDLVDELRNTRAQKILLRINSPGGDISEAVTIRNALRDHPAEIETHVDGLAASSAAWVGLAADRVIMHPQSMLMIHEPWNIIAGDAEAMRHEGEVLDKFADQIADMFVEKAGDARDAWRDVMRAETWYTDSEAVDAGLADEVAGESSSAENRYDPSILSVFKNTPAHLAPKRRAARASRTTKGTAVSATTRVETTPAEPVNTDELIRERLRFEQMRYQRLRVA